nr:NAD(P)H-dependent oxidoreductase [Alloiococcus otitis]
MSMQTLVIVSHPEIEASNSQQFLKEAVANQEGVSYHHLESAYPDGQIDIKAEQNLLKDFDRIIFQFPFYWYSAPSMLKKWIDEVMEEGVTFGTGGNLLEGKDLGLVLVIGVAEKEYQVGGREHFTISQLTTPYQALANKLGMTFLTPLSIFQFYYLSDKEQKILLVDYLQYLTLKDFSSLHSRAHWFMDQLDKLEGRVSEEADKFSLQSIQDFIEDNQLELDEMQLHLDK